LSSELETRIRRLEDRNAIIEAVIRYGVSVDRKDWQMFADCFTPVVRTDHSGDVSREEFVAIVAGALDGFGSTQHLSTNHLITFDEGDPDRAVCESDMFAQHFLAGSPHGEFYLLRARYADQMVRTPEGWRIESITTWNRWEEGNLTAVAEAIERVRSRAAPT
jgi:hypothetical protein